MTDDGNRLLISCGEASGDLYAADLVRHLREQQPNLRVTGLGGDRLLAEGAVLLTHIRDLAVIGLLEVVSKLRRLRRVFDAVLAEVDRQPPRAAVLVDYPDFNLRLARELKKRRIHVIYYVSPQIWAWRKRRIRTIRETVDLMLVIFPFEEALYREAGVPVRFVGHPLVDLVGAPPHPDAFARENGLDPRRPVIAVLPGSRPREIAHNLPPLVGAIDALGRRHPELQFAVAAAPSVDGRVFERPLRGLGVRVIHNNTAGVLAMARLALVASGTATVEAALLETPMIVVYRLSPLTYALGRPFVHVPHFAMTNLIAGRRVVPELIQGDFTSKRVAEEAESLLGDPTRLERMKQDLREIRARLGQPGASARAAREVARYLDDTRLKNY